MKLLSLQSILFTSAFSAGAISCEESKLEKQCVAACASEFCGADATEEFFDNCKSVCVSRQADAEMMGDKCGDKHEALLACVADLFCEDSGAWVDGRGGKGTYPCSEVTTEFIDACPGIWFSPA